MQFFKILQDAPLHLPCPLESVITFYFIFGKHKYILFLVTKVFVVVIFFFLRDKLKLSFDRFQLEGTYQIMLYLILYVKYVFLIFNLLRCINIIALLILS